MQQYYYNLQHFPDCPISGPDYNLSITGKLFFDKFKHMSDQTSAHYDDEMDPEFNECAYTEADNEWELKYIDEDFFDFIEDMGNRFGVFESCESQYTVPVNNVNAVKAFLEGHPNFETCEAYDNQ